MSIHVSADAIALPKATSLSDKYPENDQHDPSFR
jgi:hypothetical protein